MDQADLIWMNGEFVAWEDAKVHVLTHGLHYGTGVFEGVRCYDTEIGPAVFRHADHLDRLYKSAELYYMPIPYAREQLRAGDARADRHATACASCYIRPIVFRGYGTMGLFPLDAPVDVAIAVWEWGAYLGEEGKRNGVRAKVSSLAAHQPRLADPARQGLAASTSTRSWRRSSRTRPATRRRSCSTTTATSARARARTSSSCATASIVTPPQTAVDPRRHQPQVGRSRSRATSASRSSSATSRAPSCTWPTRSS